MTQQENNRNDSDKQKPSKQGPSDLVTGSVLFAIFLVFMTLWMVFRLP